MYVEKLELTNFRNHKELKLDFNNGLNIIYGDNAVGKTNILESMLVCSCGRSHRTVKDTDMVRFGEKGYGINLSFIKEENVEDGANHKSGISSNIEFLYTNDRGKQIRINSVSIKKMFDLMGNLIVVMFSPDDLGIIKHGPSERRRFIDIAISQLRQSYFYDLQQYNKVLTQRNHLLKSIQNNRKLLDTLDVWNQNLVQIGSRIIKSRYEYLQYLKPLITQNYYKLTEQKEHLSVEYIVPFPVENICDIENTQKIFLDKIKKNQDKEIYKGISLYGPHRDEFDILLNGKSVKIYGSQGQKRGALLAIKLAEVYNVKKEVGEYPVLLLDDVMSELDEKKQKFLMDIFINMQTFITCTDKRFSEKLNKIECNYFNIV